MKDKFCYIVFLFIFLGPGQLKAATINDAFVMNSARDLLLYFKLAGGYQQEMTNGLVNGIPVTFSFFVELHLKQKDGNLQQLVTRNFKHELSYNTLKEEFTVKLSEHDQQHVFHSLDQALLLMDQANDINIMPLTLFEDSRVYIIKVKSELSKKDLPEKFQAVRPFVKKWDFDTGWQEIHFRFMVNN